ncbi:MFS transporter [Kribbella capetownensis]|uniref:MFS transporter n=1 Tax=Kribbella capetownensis TaxID=1572659 RepID=A0A4R0JJK0_9ACTN|nr:MFS transporter [Kribbella capetownensis]TCC45924.1 MFS transporter [Kribbella capetownensis]
MRRSREAPLGRPYWVLWTAGAVSFAGDGIMFGALPLLAASITRDPRIVSLTEAVTNVGWLLLGLISGVMVDRWRRTTTMWIVDAIRAVVAGAFAVVVLLDLGTIPLLLLTAFLLGLLAPFFDNAASVVVTDVVVPASLERANGYSQASLVLLSSLIGPPLGAALFVLSRGLPILLNAVSFAGAAVLVWIIRKSAPARVIDADRHLGRELKEGLVYLWQHKLLRTLCLVLTIVNAVGAGIVAILVLYVLEVLHLPQAGFGWLVAIYAIGGVLGAFVAPRLSRRLSTSASLIGALFLSGVAIVCFGVLSGLAPVAVAAVALGFGSSWWNVVSITVRQRIVPAELLGRVTAVYRMVAFCAAPLGAVGAGFLAHRTDLRTPYLVMGLIQLAATAVSAPLIRREVRAATATP